MTPSSQILALIEKVDPNDAACPVLNKRASDRCRDFDDDCDDVPYKLSCWLHAPELGICPFIAGEPK